MADAATEAERLMESLRNLEKGYDRKFALSYCAEDVWAALEGLEHVRDALRDAAASLRAAGDRLNDCGQYASGSIARNAAFIAEDTL